MNFLCTGWNRTGTSTIGKILSNYNSKHATYSEELFDLLIEGKLNELLAFSTKIDSADDFPLNLLFREIKDINPDLNVIHTYTSSSALWIARQKTLALRAPTKRLRIANLYLYGKSSPFGNEKIFINRYEKHNKEVLTYFNGHKNFIDIDISDASQHTKLKNWLDLRISRNARTQLKFPEIIKTKKPFSTYSVGELNRIKRNITIF